MVTKEPMLLVQKMKRNLIAVILVRAAHHCKASMDLGGVLEVPASTKKSHASNPSGV
jgi:hypothetical protein